MYKLPIGGANKPTLTQVYGNTSNNAWYSANGIKNPFHNGVDFVCGTPVQTYGTPLVCPFPEGGYVEDVTYESPMTTKGNGVVVRSNFINGVQYRIILWHSGEIKVRVGDKLKEGDIISYIGNSGLVSPAPTTDAPYNGSHLHFGCYKFVNGQNIYTPPTVLGETDPLLYFDKNQWYAGADSGYTHDVAPINWGTQKLGITDWFSRLLYAIRWWN